MQIGGMVVWWYSGGLARTAQRVFLRIDGLIDYFSIGLLLKTLFSPFRQISAGRVDGPLNIKLQAFFDNIVSRVVGAAVRTIVLIAGTAIIASSMVIGLITLILWTVLPLAPIVGLTLTLARFAPWVIL